MSLRFNWNPGKVKLILGPPGTGKTTRLMQELDVALQTYDPRRICFVAFTKKAATEAVTRAAAQFQLTHEQLLHFRTLHSLAFRQQGFSSKEIMGVGDYINIARSLGLHISYRGIREEGSFFGQTKGDRLLFLVNIARLQNKSIEQIHADWIGEHIPFYELELMHETIEAYKKSTGKLDFTDVIDRFIEDGLVPDLDVLFVDEAQDLAPIQWTMVSKLAENVGEVFVAGDDDQAIFRWAGADVKQFIDLPVDKTIVLDQSYRVPSKIATCANRVIELVETRHKKLWKPKLEQGTARFINTFETLDLSTGSWMLLARNSYLLSQYQEHCLRRGYVFESSLEAPVDPGLLACIKNWERLRKGQFISVDQALSLYDYFGSKVGVAYGFKARLKEENPERVVNIADLKREFGLLVDTIWHEAMDRIPLEQREYLLGALRRGEKVEGDPRIKISTIHGVKGGEADNVVLLTDMAARTYQEYLNNPEDEARVWYVAITRAQQALYVVHPTHPNHYPLDTILRSR